MEFLIFNVKQSVKTRFLREKKYKKTIGLCCLKKVIFIKMIFLTLTNNTTNKHIAEFVTAHETKTRQIHPTNLER